MLIRSFCHSDRGTEAVDSIQSIVELWARVKPGGRGNGSGNRERVKSGSGNHAHYAEMEQISY